MSTTEKEDSQSVIPSERIDQMIYIVRGQKVMLDVDLAELYGVETGALVRAVKRNIVRFPEDFLIQMTSIEWEALRGQFGTLKKAWGGRRYSPSAFTEQGVAMLSSVLKSERAALVNVAIMRTFVRMRRMAENYKDLVERIDHLEKTHDKKFSVIFDALRKLMAPPPEKMKKEIGFRYKKS